MRGRKEITVFSISRTGNFTKGIMNFKNVSFTTTLKAFIVLNAIDFIDIIK